MSRLIVKNLPNGIKEERLKNIFGVAGKITDCALKYTQDGKFRKFAFVGFKTEQEAATAMKQLNKTFVDTTRIQVEVARDFGDHNKPRAWSKYSKESSAYQKSHPEEKKPAKEKGKKKKKERTNPVVNELLGELNEDTEFQEFLDAHQKVGSKPVWTNDSGAVRNKDRKAETEEDEEGEEESKGSMDVEDKEMEVDEESEGEEVDDVNKKNEDIQEEKNKVAAKKGVSDLEYLRSKMADKKELLSDSDSDGSDMETEADENSKEGTGKGKPTDTKQNEVSDNMFMLKMRGLPVTTGEAAIKEFFRPLDIVRIRIPRNTKKKPIGIAYVGFKTEHALQQAIGRNKNFIGGKRIFLKLMQKDEIAEQIEVDQPRPWELKHQEPSPEDEGIAESGRLFVRNLSYSCTEEDLEEAFGKYGPLSEVNLPIDSLTKKRKGFAFITFMIPEHAVSAFTEMDGKVFQGRMLHILPSKAKSEELENLEGGSSYKKQQQAKQKANASSSHNWNTLFLGANAVLDVMADKYGTSKDKILDDDIKGSLGVRLALGETQIVSETRDFLIENGVSLDSFSQANAPRSKTVILVKNLPAGTSAGELEEVFAKYGSLGRVIMPPSGITAIVEYMTQAEAKAGFTRLAYTKFRHVPLYLEWAPVEVFRSSAATTSNVGETGEGTQQEADDTGKVEKNQQNENSSDESEEEEVGSTLFVKNINFDSTDADLKEIFSKCSKVKTASIARKKDLKNPGKFLSLGYGFVEFVSPNGAAKAVKELQHTELDGHQLEIKISNRTTAQPATKGRKKQKVTKQTSTKILVRNIPFEAKKKEIEELFKVFGELKFVRLPKKMGGTGSHRGFGFVDFLTRQDAKRAFKALCHSTHLFGRRLVLEWADSAAEDLDELRKRTAEHFHEGGRKKKLTKAGLMDQLHMAEDD